MSYDLKIARDNPVAFWKLDEMSGTEILDYSGCNNHGTYNNYIFTNTIPLIPGGVSGTKISNNSYLSFQIDRNYYTDLTTPSFATKYNPTDNFSIELWLYPKIISSEQTPIFADVSSNTGIFYENGNIIFMAEGESVEYTLSNLNKAIHIVAIYSFNQISIFIDGKLCASKSLTDFKFTAEDATFTCGPVVGASDSFIIDGVAVYRYALDASKIFDHYTEIFNIPSIQIAYPDNGFIFQFDKGAVNRRFTYGYPEEKPWSEFTNDVLRHDNANGYIGITTGTGSVSTSLTDVISVPNISDLPYSLIEWDGDNGITVQVSQDELTYNTCTNNMPIPLDDPYNGILYLKVSFDSSDSSRFIPKLYSLRVSFYDNPQIYSSNGPDVISPVDGALQLGISMKNYPVLTRDYRNGLRTIDGFKVSTDKDIYSIETFYTPEELNASSIIPNLSWDASGSLTKTDIDFIYINGSDKTTASNVSDLFNIGDLHHVVIVLSTPLTGDININSGTNEALYNNFTIYPDQIGQDMALEHYNLYIDNPSTISSGSTIGMTESSINYYNNDWIVQQTI